MSRLVSWSVGCILLSVLSLAGCSGKLETASAQAPPAPTMPAGWKVTSDRTFAMTDIRPIADKLGGEVRALRNTVYDVRGKSVKLNTIVSASDADADRIMASLRTMKPDEFLLRRGLTIYEFVGTNDVIPDMRAGRLHIRSTHGS